MKEGCSMQKKFMLIVAGQSGAGKTEALSCLRDMGYDCVDNLPLRLIPALLKDVNELPERMVLGLDATSKDIATATSYRDAIQAIRDNEGLDCHVIYMCADAEELVRRFKETRRAHPFAAGRPVSESIALESAVLQPMRELADSELDTTEFTPRYLWQYFRQHFEATADGAFQVFVMSFGFKHGMPREADVVLDVRFLRNPYWDKELRSRTGFDEEVQMYVKQDDLYAENLRKMTDLLNLQLKRFQETDRPHVTVAIGCTGGKHRSVTVAENLQDLLKDSFKTSVHHRDINRDKQTTTV